MKAIINTWKIAAIWLIVIFTPVTTVIVKLLGFAFGLVNGLGLLAAAVALAIVNRERIVRLLTADREDDVEIDW